MRCVLGFSRAGSKRFRIPNMGGGGKTDGNQDDRGSIFRSGANPFGRKVSRIAVAQICESIGFEGFKQSALDSLADIVIRYLRDLGTTAKLYANLSGRTECNACDIIQGLADLGFSDASASAITEIEEYVAHAEEIPFPQPVSRFPVTRLSQTTPTFFQMGETSSSMHIPLWLPAFPDPHTYVQTPVWNERVSDPRTDKIELVRQHTKAERSLLSLQQRLVRNESSFATATTSEKPGDSGNVLEVCGIENSFISETLQDDDGDMLGEISAKTQAEKHATLLETFAPTIEAMRDGLDSGSEGEKCFPEKQSSVFLELKGGKKLYGESLDLRIHKIASRRNESLFGREDEKDDKKRRVEFILRKSMENQQELSQL